MTPSTAAFIEVSDVLCSFAPDKIAALTIVDGYR